MMTLLRELGSFLLGLICIIGGLLAYASIGIVTNVYGANITFHYILVGSGSGLIILGAIFMYLFIKK